MNICVFLNVQGIIGLQGNDLQQMLNRVYNATKSMDLTKRIVLKINVSNESSL